ncbi:hypothetical protein PCK2_000857 [Pneumocystis canis]|nr:hypothetical protein PCK2_000857 [Pneumocystis canis]
MIQYTFYRCYTSLKQKSDCIYSKTLCLPKTIFPLQLNVNTISSNLQAITQDLYEWQKNHLLDKNVFILHDGPPYVNGELHIALIINFKGHALNKILKDIILRINIMKRRPVSYIPGWDCHGLPIELKVFEDFQWKHSYEPLTIRQKARKYALDTIKCQRESFETFGIMADWDKSYRTLDNLISEDVSYYINQLKIFKKMVQKDLIHRKYKPVYWSPSSKTALAEGELIYVDDHTSYAVFVKFPLIHLGKARLISFIQSRSEWCISRQRAWGVPIPVLYNLQNEKPLLTVENIDHIVETIQKYGIDAWWENLDPNIWVAPMYKENSTEYKKGLETMDVWFDSGISWKVICNDNDNDDVRLNPPIDLVLEGSDQHRGWFQSLLLTFIASHNNNLNIAPYRTVITHGHVLDQYNQKMSKSLGNIINPKDIIFGGKDIKKEPAYGIDVLRLWVAGNDFTTDINISSSGLKNTAEMQRKFRTTLRFLLGNLYDWTGEEREWIKQLSKEYPILAFHASINNPFGKGSLIQLLRQFSALHSDKRQISVGFIGYPNTGKSSVINTLKSKKVCNVAPIPGETKVWQYIRMTSKIYMIDCPGIVPPNDDDSETAIVMKGALRVEKISSPEQHIQAILDRCETKHLERTYEISGWENDSTKFLELLARKTGKLLKGGEVDESSVAKMVINDFIRGKVACNYPMNCY